MCRLALGAVATTAQIAVVIRFIRALACTIVLELTGGHAIAPLAYFPLRQTADLALAVRLGAAFHL